MSDKGEEQHQVSIFPPPAFYSTDYFYYYFYCKWMSSHENQGLSTIHINLAKGKVQLHVRLQFFWAEISPLFMISLYLPKLAHIKP